MLCSFSGLENHSQPAVQDWDDSNKTKQKVPNDFWRTIPSPFPKTIPFKVASPIKWPKLQFLEKRHKFRAYLFSVCKSERRFKRTKTFSCGTFWSARVCEVRFFQFSNRPSPHELVRPQKCWLYIIQIKILSRCKVPLCEYGKILSFCLPKLKDEFFQ